MGTAFLRHESKFYLYALYNKNKPKSDSLMSENGTQFFKAKQIELNDKMDLASYLLKPVQRMGKYALLLQQLMKACADVQVSRPRRVKERETKSLCHSATSYVLSAYEQQSGDPGGSGNAAEGGRDGTIPAAPR